MFYSALIWNFIYPTQISNFSTVIMFHSCYLQMYVAPVWLCKTTPQNGQKFPSWQFAFSTYLPRSSGTSSALLSLYIYHTLRVCYDTYVMKIFIWAIVTSYSTNQIFTRERLWFLGLYDFRWLWGCFSDSLWCLQ